MKAQNGQPAELKSGPEVGQNLTDLARATLKKIDDILDENKKPLNTAIGGLSTFADMLGKNSERIEGLIGGLEKLAGVGPKATIAVYDLVAPTTFAPSSKPTEAQLVVADPTSILAYDTQNILIRSAAGTYTTCRERQVGRQSAEAAAGENCAKLRECPPT